MSYRKSVLLTVLAAAVALLGPLSFPTTASASTTSAAAERSQASRAAAFAAAEATGRKPTTTFSFVSEPGDYIGGGEKRIYRSPTTKIALSGNAKELTLSVDSEEGEWWYAQIAAPKGDTLRVGKYLGAERAAFRTGRAPGLDIHGSGKGCNKVMGEFSIEQLLTDANGMILSLEATAVQHCEGGQAALRAVLRYRAHPLAYKMASDPGDYIGGGATKTYTGSTTLFNVSGTTRDGVTAGIDGRGDGWSISLYPPTGQVLEVGKTYQAGPIAEGLAGLMVGGNGRGCSRGSGSFTIDDLIADKTGAVKGIAVRLRHHCDENSAGLTGDFRFFAGKFPQWMSA